MTCWRFPLGRGRLRVRRVALGSAGAAVGGGLADIVERVRRLFGVAGAAEYFGLRSAAALDLRREDVPSLWRAGAGALSLLSGCGAPVSTAPIASERRKVVTVVFADVVGSTALGERVDPETLRWAMQRWFGRMRDVVERHGGTIENYIGDAVMAVFGVPVAHEDDALRAVRAAAEMREEVVALRDELRGERGVELAVRIGINTGRGGDGRRARMRACSPRATRSTSPRGSNRRLLPAAFCSAARHFALSAMR